MVSNAAVLFCELVLFIFIKILIASVILQLACALYNLLAGASAARAAYYHSGTFPGVPRPEFDQAVGIVFFATLINAPGTFIIFKLLRLAGQVSSTSHNYLVPTACIALPMGILVLAGLITCILPTSFGKGLLVSLLSHLFAAILASAIVLIVLAFGLRDIVR